MTGSRSTPSPSTGQGRSSSEGPSRRVISRATACPRDTARTDGLPGGAQETERGLGAPREFEGEITALVAEGDWLERTVAYEGRADAVRTVHDLATEMFVEWEQWRKSGSLPVTRYVKCVRNPQGRVYAPPTDLAFRREVEVLVADRQGRVLGKVGGRAIRGQENEAAEKARFEWVREHARGRGPATTVLDVKASATGKSIPGWRTRARTTNGPAETVAFQEYGGGWRIDENAASQLEEAAHGQIGTGFAERAVELFRYLAQIEPWSLRVLEGLRQAHGECGNEAEENGIALEIARKGRVALETCEGFDWKDAKVGYGLLENRPFLRALQAVAMLEVEDGTGEGALKRMRRIASLCPDDALGMRHLIAHALCAEKRWDELDAHLGDAREEDEHGDLRLAVLLLKARQGGTQARDEAKGEIEEVLRARWILAERVSQGDRPTRPRRVGYRRADGFVAAEEHWKHYGALWKEVDRGWGIAAAQRLRDAVRMPGGTKGRWEEGREARIETYRTRLAEPPWMSEAQNREAWTLVEFVERRRNAGVHAELAANGHQRCIRYTNAKGTEIEAILHGSWQATVRRTSKDGETQRRELHFEELAGFIEELARE